MLAAGRDINSETAQVKAIKDIAATAGQHVSLNASRDINLLSAQDTDLTTGKNETKGGTLGIGIGIGIGIGVGSGGWGITFSASLNRSTGKEKGNGVTQNETTLDAGHQLTSGRDTTLAGAQVSGEKVVADVGRDFTLSSG